MDKKFSKLLFLSRKIAIVYCAAYIGFYAHDQIFVDATQPGMIVESVDGGKVLGDQNQAGEIPPAPLVNNEHSGDWIGVAENYESKKEASLSGEVEVVSNVESTPTPNTPTEPISTPDPNVVMLDAWWSIMEYHDRLVASITATEPIECEFILASGVSNKSTVKQSVPMNSETCTFETTIKDSNYILWGKAISEDGKIREFGRR